VAREQDFHRFEPIFFSAAGGEVLMLVREDFTFRRSGRRVELEVVHHFTVRNDGRIVRYRSFHDSARYAAAYAEIRPAPAAR
jgi:ketosteroid isomerase-like protein